MLVSNNESQAELKLETRDSRQETRDKRQAVAQAEELRSGGVDLRRKRGLKELNVITHHPSRKKREVFVNPFYYSISAELPSPSAANNYQYCSFWLSLAGAPHQYSSFLRY